MVEVQAIWHVAVDGEPQGPLTAAEVLKYLRNGTFTEQDLAWRPGFPDWKPIRQVGDFGQPNAQDSMTASVRSSRFQDIVQDTEEPDGVLPIRKKWSLWKSANIGLLVSACSLLIHIADGQGFDVANYAHTASSGTIAELTGELLSGPLVFVFVAMTRNLLKRGRPESNASIIWSASTFVVLFVMILGAFLPMEKLIFPIMN